MVSMLFFWGGFWFGFRLCMSASGLGRVCLAPFPFPRYLGLPAVLCATGSLSFLTGGWFVSGEFFWGAVRVPSRVRLCGVGLVCPLSLPSCSVLAGCSSVTGRRGSLVSGVAIFGGVFGGRSVPGHSVGGLGFCMALVSFGGRLVSGFVPPGFSPLLGVHVRFFPSLSRVRASGCLGGWWVYRVRPPASPSTVARLAPSSFLPLVSPPLPPFPLLPCFFSSPSSPLSWVGARLPASPRGRAGWVGLVVGAGRGCMVPRSVRFGSAPAGLGLGWSPSTVLFLWGNRGRVILARVSGCCWVACSWGSGPRLVRVYVVLSVLLLPSSSLSFSLPSPSPPPAPPLLFLPFPVPCSSLSSRPSPPGLRALWARARPLGCGSRRGVRGRGLVRYLWACIGRVRFVPRGVGSRAVRPRSLSFWRGRVVERVRPGG